MEMQVVGWHHKESEIAQQGVSKRNAWAELAASTVALESDLPKHILSDIEVSVLLMERAMFRPVTLCRHMHKLFLELIVCQFQAREKDGLRTAIQKVKAHIGVVGNEQADTTAGEVANGTVQPDTAVTIGAASEAADDVWLAQGRGAPTNTSTPHNMRTHSANMRSHLLAAMPPTRPYTITESTRHWLRGQTRTLSPPLLSPLPREYTDCNA